MGAPGSPKRTPDFLWNLPALANFMRLSLMKAAHAGVGWIYVQEIRIPGPKKMGEAQRSLSLNWLQTSLRI
jgi:hypothetical protein